MAEQEEIKQRIAAIEKKLWSGETITVDEERYLMKYRDGMTDIEIEFALSKLDEDNQDVIY